MDIRWIGSSQFFGTRSQRSSTTCAPSTRHLPNQASTWYTYRVRHRLFNGQIVWGRKYSFKVPPYPGEDSLKCVIYGDLGKIDVSNEYNDIERGSVSTTHLLVKDLKNIHTVMHIGNIS